MSGIDYSGVIAEVEQKIEQLQATLAVLRELSGVAPSEQAEAIQRDVAAPAPAPPRPPRPQAPSANGDVQNDTFFGLSTPAAIRKFLAMTKRPQKTPDISKALLEGGQIHARDTTTAYNNVYAALKRMRKSGEGVRIKSGEWALAEWYSSNKSKSEGE